MPDEDTGSLGHPRVHLRRTDSTNERARRLAIAGAPHGTTITADEQSAGRGRQGRSWLAPPGSALLCSLILRDPPPLLSLIAGVAVCDVVGDDARVKWPNDVVLERPHPEEREPTRGQIGSEPPWALAKLAGILVEGRPQENWSVLGIGVNVAVHIEELPAEVRAGAASLQRPRSAIEPLLADLLVALARRLTEPTSALLESWRTRDALYGRDIAWNAHGPQSSGERGRAEGIDDKGQLLVRREDGGTTALGAGEVHLESVG
ncbi:MAG TPA: biotin--[acetyl-CoA-carboxylase] ligase [Solirubrobacteraceae bacterium]|jgi:BirA family biotin operon repressor/biotin-[acetyl-CoA-carboxylase] ligase|nr:biotin--[acetyl-CoA-carboxylase] ligase [Solirubrobacteraceae bacterium]